MIAATASPIQNGIMNNVFDCVIVGGSYAGLSAALQLVRARRRVAIVDAGKPRNRFADHSHGVLAQDGRPGSEILAVARDQIATYPTATFIKGEAVSVDAHDGVFAVTMHDGQSVSGSRLLLATGVIDILPEISGLVERWGKTVATCPYCHGFEIGGGSIGVLANGAISVHQASLVADWGDVTFFTNGNGDLDEAARSLLERRNVRIEPATVTAIEGAAPQINGVRLSDGRLVHVKALFVAPEIRMGSPFAEQLGCAFDDTPVGAIIRTDASKATTVPGVYAAGDAARMQPSITFASADGAAAGVGIHQSLIAALPQ